MQHNGNHGSSSSSRTVAAGLQWPPVGQSEEITAEEFYRRHSWQEQDLKSIAEYKAQHAIASVIFTGTKPGVMIKACAWDNRLCKSRHRSPKYASVIEAGRLVPDNQFLFDDPNDLLDKRRDYFLSIRNLLLNRHSTHFTSFLNVIRTTYDRHLREYDDALHEPTQVWKAKMKSINDNKLLERRPELRAQLISTINAELQEKEKPLHNTLISKTTAELVDKLNVINDHGQRLAQMQERDCKLHIFKSWSSRNSNLKYPENIPFPVVKVMRGNGRPADLQPLASQMEADAIAMAKASYGLLVRRDEKRVSKYSPKTGNLRAPKTDQGNERVPLLPVLERALGPPQQGQPGRQQKGQQSGVEVNRSVAAALRPTLPASLALGLCKTPAGPRFAGRDKYYEPQVFDSEEIS